MVFTAPAAATYTVTVVGNVNAAGAYLLQALPGSVAVYVGSPTRVGPTRAS